MGKAKKDYSAIKFEVSEALGEWMNCLYLKWNEQGKMEYDFVHHTDSDGASAMTKILEREGSKVPTIPVQKKILRANFIEKLFLLKKFIKLTKAVNIQWQKERRDCNGVPPCFFVIHFTCEQTLQLEEAAKTQEISLNSLLLWSLDQSVSSHLLKEHSERKWVCPINMRVDQSQRYGNHSASIIINSLSPYTKTSPHFFQEEVRNFLKNQMHWGSQIYSNMARYIGFKGTLHIAKKIKEIGTGVFSNMGHWPLEDTRCSAKSSGVAYRVFIPPATQVLPISAGAFTWQEKLTLSLQLHPSLAQDEQMAQKIAQNWVNQLISSSEVNVDKYQWSDFKEAPKHLIINT